MSYFEYTKDQVEELIVAYEDLLSAVGEIYYLQDGEAIDKAVRHLNEVLERLGFE